MLETWSAEPDKRPTFSQLVSIMGDFLEANVKQVREGMRWEGRGRGGWRGGGGMLEMWSSEPVKRHHPPPPTFSQLVSIMGDFLEDNFKQVREGKGCERWGGVGGGVARRRGWNAGDVVG